jgi:hypothetical protein
MKALGCNMRKYPEERLDGLLELTDETGIIQHTKFSLIDRKYGYTTDDNARALIAVLRHHQIFQEPRALRLAKLYLTFLLHMQKEDGKYHNVLGYNREYQDKEGTNDSLGHALWALGKTINSRSTDEMKKVAKWLFDTSLPEARKFTSPRARAFTLLGLTEYQEALPEDENIEQNIRFFADHLVNQYGVEASREWRWFETSMTYANPRIPQSLLSAYVQTGEERYLEVSKESLDFLVDVQFENSTFLPIGTEAWYHKSGTKSKYDQQPIEASCMVDSTLDMAEISGENKYFKIALNAFQWYHGKNNLKIDLINQNNFTCYDGLTSKGLNLNQGAESTISYYLAYLKLKQINLV